MKPKHSKMHYFGVFLFFLGFFSLLQFSTSNFFDPDSYYNVKHSTIIAENNLKPIVEPWVKFHFLSYAPTDGYFLFHEITAIFIKIFNPVIGSKIFASISAALIFFLFYFLACKVTTKNKAFLYSLILLFSSFTFTYRLLQIRAFVLSISLLILIYYFLNKKRYYLVTILCIISTLLYHLSIIIVFWTLIDIFFTYLNKKYLNLKPLIATLGGVLIGLIIHPHTYNQINLIFAHLIQIPHLKSQGLFGAGGGEIQFQGVGPFIAHNSLLISIYLISIFVWLKQICKQKNLISTEGTKLLLLSLPWFIVSIFYVRGTEYWVPFAGLFCLHIISANEISFKNKITTLLERLGRDKKIFKLTFQISITLFLLIHLSLFFIFVKKEEQNWLNGYVKINNYLIGNTPDKSLVCYPNWDMFAPMFYLNTHNRYISAFDPVFTFNYDSKLFLTTNQLFYIDKECKDKDCPNDFIKNRLAKLTDVLYNQLDCQYFLLSRIRHPILDSYLQNHPDVFIPIDFQDPTAEFKLFSLAPR